MSWEEGGGGGGGGGGSWVSLGAGGVELFGGEACPAPPSLDETRALPLACATVLLAAIHSQSSVLSHDCDTLAFSMQYNYHFNGGSKYFS